MTAIPNYFKLPGVSNSNLGELKREYYGVEDPSSRLKEVFNFGNLVDAMLTERHRLQSSLHRLHEPGGTFIDFDYVTWSLAYRLAESLKRDPVVSIMLKVMVGQYIFSRTLRFEFEGERYTIKGKCKYDGFAKVLSTGVDYKTTACKTQSQFNASIEFFDYDRAAAWYMDLAGINYFWIIGICKSTGQIFKHAIERGDETHKRGVAKYSVWAYRWLLLIDNFKLITQ